jgi:tRNA(fMet)-specific endonuclease VapC
MEAVLLDTDVFSYLLKARDARADAYRPHVKGKTVAVSFVTIGELFYGAEKKNWSPANRANLQEKLKTVVVVPYDEELCRTYARIRAALPAGIVVGANDLWIAASAMRHSLSLVTNNRKHFEPISGLTIISETPSKAVQIATPGNLFE